MQKNYCVVNGRLQPAEGDSCPVTIIAQPTDEERRYCIDVLGIDEHNLNSALDPDELSRIEFEPEHVVVIYSVPRNYSEEDRFLFRGGTAGAFLFKDRLILVTSEDGAAFENVNLGRVQTHNGRLLKFILSAILHFRGHLKGISMISDELQDKINTAMENKHLIHLFTLEKSLVYYVSFIHSNGLLLEKLKNNAAKLGFGPEEVELLDDIIIENTQCYKQSDIYSNIIASLMDARASIVGNNLNFLMRKLMIITLAIMTPSLVVGLFSMNVQLPMQKHPEAFWVILILATVSAVGVLTFWLNRKA